MKRLVAALMAAGLVLSGCGEDVRVHHGRIEAKDYEDPYTSFIPVAVGGKGVTSLIPVNHPAAWTVKVTDCDLGQTTRCHHQWVNVDPGTWSAAQVGQAWDDGTGKANS